MNAVAVPFSGTFEVWCQTDVGLRRENNQDFFLFDQEAAIYVVADGMGGHSGGEVASRLAAETIIEVVKSYIHGENAKGGSRKTPARSILTAAYEKASHRVYQASLKPGAGLEGMGTTLVAVLIQGSTAYIANVGDSRAYYFKNGYLWQITDDHSLMNEQLRAGLINEDELSRFVGKNVITRSVGFEAEVSVDIIEREVEVGDLFLLCSDGLSGLVKDDKIAEILKTYKAGESVSKCIDEAKKNGGDDNVTAMLLCARRK